MNSIFNMKRTFLSTIVVSAIFIATPAFTQIKPTAYLKNLHSHNDYTRNHPFALAYGLGFGSIEVDLFLKDGELFVAHEYDEIRADKTFDQLYLRPILEAFANSADGFLYPQNGQLQLLIDAKTDGVALLQVLTEKIKPYRELFDSKNDPKAVKIVISGNRPQADAFHLYDEIFFFDGELNKFYTAEQLKRIGLFSAPFPIFSEWNGLGKLTYQDSISVRTTIDSVHRLGKKFRFWATPETRTSWYEWLKMGIDYINTDQPMVAAEFMRTYPKSSYNTDVFHDPYIPRHIKRGGGGSGRRT